MGNSKSLSRLDDKAKVTRDGDPRSPKDLHKSPKNPPKTGHTFFGAKRHSAPTLFESSASILWPPNKNERQPLRRRPRGGSEISSSAAMTSTFHTDENVPDIFKRVSQEDKSSTQGTISTDDKPGPNISDQAVASSLPDKLSPTQKKRNTFKTGAKALLKSKNTPDVAVAPSLPDTLSPPPKKRPTFAASAKAILNFKHTKRESVHTTVPALVPLAAPIPSTEKSLSNDNLSGDTHSSNKHFSDKPSSDKNFSDKPSSDKNFSDKPSSDKASSNKNVGDKPPSDKHSNDKSSSDKNSNDKNSSDKNSSDKHSDDKQSDDEMSDDYPSEEDLSDKKEETTKKAKPVRPVRPIKAPRPPLLKDDEEKPPCRTVARTGCCSRYVAPPPVYFSNRGGGGGGDKGSCAGRDNGRTKNPLDRLHNVDVIESLCYYPPKDDNAECFDCDGEPMDMYEVCEDCGEMEYIGPKCPEKKPRKPVTYTRKQRFNFATPEDDIPRIPAFPEESGPPFVWPSVANPRRPPHRAASFDEIPVGKNPKHKKPAKEKARKYIYDAENCCLRPKKEDFDEIPVGPRDRKKKKEKDEDPGKVSEDAEGPEKSKKDKKEKHRRKSHKRKEGRASGFQGESGEYIYNAKDGCLRRMNELDFAKVDREEEEEEDCCEEEESFCYKVPECQSYPQEVPCQPCQVQYCQVPPCRLPPCQVPPCQVQPSQVQPAQAPPCQVQVPPQMTPCGQPGMLANNPGMVAAVDEPDPKIYQMLTKMLANMMGGAPANGENGTGGGGGLGGLNLNGLNLNGLNTNQNNCSAPMSPFYDMMNQMPGYGNGCGIPGMGMSQFPQHPGTTMPIIMMPGGSCEDGHRERKKKKKKKRRSPTQTAAEEEVNAQTEGDGEAASSVSGTV